MLYDFFYRDMDMDLENTCMVPLTTPVMTVTNANGVYEIALEEETCVMLQQQQQQILQQHQQNMLRKKQEQQQEDKSQKNEENGQLKQETKQTPAAIPKSPAHRGKESEAPVRQVSPCPSHEEATKLNVEPRKEGKKLDEETKQVWTYLKIRGQFYKKKA